MRPSAAPGPARVDVERTSAALDAFAERLAGVAGRRHRCFSGPVIRIGCSASTAIWQTRCRRRDVPSSPPRMGRLCRHNDPVRSTHAQPRLRTRSRAGTRTRRPEPRCVRPAHTRIHRSRFVPLWRPPRRPAGRFPELVIGDHGWVCGAGQLGFEAIGLGGYGRSRAVRRGRRRGGCPSSFRLMTLCGLITTGRLLAMYSIERVCHSRPPMRISSSPLASPAPTSGE